MKRAVALRPITAPSAVLPYLEGLDMVLVMTVEPGFGGQAFLEHQLDTIRQVRALIERYNPPAAWRWTAGSTPRRRRSWPPVDTLVAGSAVYGAAEPAAAIAALRGLTHAVLPPALEKLVEQFARLPGIGRKTAQRWPSSSSPAGGTPPSPTPSWGKGGHPLLPRVPELLRGGRPVPRLPGSQAGHVGHLRGGRSQGRGGHGALPGVPGLYHVLHGVISP